MTTVQPDCRQRSDLAFHYIRCGTIRTKNPLDTNYFSLQAIMPCSGRERSRFYARPNVSRFPKGSSIRPSFGQSFTSQIIDAPWSDSWRIICSWRNFGPDGPIAHIPRPATGHFSGIYRRGRAALHSQETRSGRGRHLTPISSSLSCKRRLLVFTPHQT